MTLVNTTTIKHLSGVLEVKGDNVDNSDPCRPVVNTVGVQSLTGEFVDNTDPDNPIINPQVGTYGGLKITSIGTQEINTTEEILEFDSEEVSNGMVNDVTNNQITVPISGDYKISFHGSATLKADVIYSFSVKVNDTDLIILGNVDSATDYHLGTFGYEMTLTLVAGDFVQLSAVSDTAVDNEFYMQIGTGFSIVKL